MESTNSANHKKANPEKILDKANKTTHNCVQEEIYKKVSTLDQKKMKLISVPLNNLWTNSIKYQTLL